MQQEAQELPELLVQQEVRVLLELREQQGQPELLAQLVVQERQVQLAIQE